MNEQTVTLPVSGMTCVNCAMNIERGVKKLPGVSESNVNFAAEQANVSFDPGLLTVQDLVGGIEKAGYSVPAAKMPSRPRVMRKSGTRPTNLLWA